MPINIEDLTTEQQATLRSEIGVNTESILALLEGETVPTQGVGLANTGAVAIDPGDSERVLGLDSKNRVVLHTGNDNGDDLAHLISSNQVVQIEGSFLDTELENIPAFSRAIGKIRLAAADAVVGKRISISGMASVTYSGTNRPDSGFQLVFHPQETVIDTEGGSNGVRVGLGVPTTKEAFLFTAELFLLAGTTGKFILQAANTHGGFHFKDSGGTATTEIFSLTSAGTIGTIGVDQDILISVCSSDYGGSISSFITGGCLSANIYTP